MTLYVGEQVRISTKAREYAVKGTTGALITDDNVTSVKVTVLNTDGTVRIDDADMTWSDTEQIWFYKWPTATGSPAVTPGTYKYRITLVGADGEPSVEWGSIRLSRQPAITT